jgi:hypothetical protein
MLLVYVGVGVGVWGGGCSPRDSTSVAVSGEGEDALRLGEFLEDSRRHTQHVIEHHCVEQGCRVHLLPTPAYVSMRQHTSAYVGIRHLT